MKNKKGFTLVELLAVIAILAILVIIALPNVMGMFNSAKKSSFTTELKEVYKVAQQEWMMDSMTTTGDQVYSRCKTCTGKSLQLSGRSELDYYIKVDKAGKVAQYYATDGTYQFSYDGDLLATQINDVEEIANLDEDDTFSIKNDKVIKKIVIPPIDDFLMVSLHNYKDSNFLRSNILKKDIEKVNFVLSTSGHSPNGTNCWDVSYGNNGNVLVWADDTDNDGLYELTIGSNKTIFIKNGSSLFYDMVNLDEINGLNNINTSQATSMESMFGSKSSNDGLNIQSLDLRSFDTSNVTNMRNMFSNCKDLTKLDVSSFNTSKVTNMNGMFSYCKSLTSLNVSSFDTSKVTDMGYMFYYLKNMSYLDTSNFNTSKVTNMKSMFNSCEKLEILDLHNFDTSNVTTMLEMFSHSYKLKNINIKSFNTSKVTNMKSMFSSLQEIETIDVSSFNTSNVTDMSWMFGQCYKLKTIYVSNGFNITNVNNSDSMFKYSSKIVGGKGTTYNSGLYDKTYAHVDGGSSNPGYFTLAQ